MPEIWKRHNLKAQQSQKMAASTVTTAILPTTIHAAPKTSTSLTGEQEAEWQQVASRARRRRDVAIIKWQQTRGLPCDSVVRESWDSHPVRPISVVADVDRFEKQRAEITGSRPSDLLKNIASGLWSAEQTLAAFADRAALAHYLTNPLTDVFFEKAMERARGLDRALKTTGRAVGPLHGLPISIKDVFNIRGLDTTLGFISQVGCPAVSTDTLIERLEDAGAVFYCKTNIPQALMSGECTNFLFGRTASAHNTALSAGGSSGGEGSLIALGGSPLGIGTDIAGSIRTPANFNGIYGLCPSFGRFPMYGPGHALGLSSINAVAGPLCRSIDGLELYTETILNLRPWEWDSSCVPLPWNQDAYDQAAPPRVGSPLSQQLCFGLIADDSIVTPHPPIQRCMREVKEALIAMGHIVIDLPRFFDASDNLEDLLMTIFRADGGKGLRQQLAKYNEPITPELLQMSPSDTLSVDQLAELGRKVRTLQQKYLDKWTATKRNTGSSRPVDVMILPSGAHVACPHSTMEYFLYEAISNILDWTCATIPVGFVDQQLDGEWKPLAEPLSQLDSANWERYSPEAYRDAPVCLQVMGQRFTEEKVLGALRTIDRALGRDADFQACELTVQGE